MNPPDIIAQSVFTKICLDHFFLFGIAASHICVCTCLRKCPAESIDCLIRNLRINAYHLHFSRLLIHRKLLFLPKLMFLFACNNFFHSHSKYPPVLIIFYGNSNCFRQTISDHAGRISLDTAPAVHPASVAV